jgi:hypothetical protein
MTLRGNRRNRVLSVFLFGWFISDMIRATMTKATVSCSSDANGRGVLMRCCSLATAPEGTNGVRKLKKLRLCGQAQPLKSGSTNIPQRFNSHSGI